jgi:hypothetical protein
MSEAMGTHFVTPHREYRSEFILLCVYASRSGLRIIHKFPNANNVVI